MNALFLTKEEICDLTGYKRHGKQCAALAKMGVPYRTNAAGRPIVVRAILEGPREVVQAADSGSRWQSRKAQQNFGKSAA